MMPAKKPSMLTLVLIVQDTSLSLELPKSDDSLAGDMGNRLLQSVFPTFMVGYT